MTKNNQGNDQVIADFFKKSIQIVLALGIVGATVYVLTKPKKQQNKVIEKEYIAPSNLKAKIEIPKILFTEEAKRRGIKINQTNGATGERMLPETMGAGIAFIDVDNDNDQDLFLSNATNWSWDENKSSATQKLFINDGKGNFTDVSEEWNINEKFYATGVAVGDVNNDGYKDLFVSAVGNNKLFINQQGKNFEESSIALNCSNSDWSTSSGFFDYDKDGDLDLMVLNYVEWSRELDLAADYKIDGIGRAYGPPSNFPGTHNCLFENTLSQGTLAFNDVSEEKGIIVKNNATGEYNGKSLALVFDDINNDSWVDIIVANDTTRNFVFINQTGNKFVESGEEFGLAYNSSGKSTGAMGIDSSFYKNNDDQAIIIGNFANEMTSFYVNRSNLGFFTDEAVISGIGPESRLALSFGLFFFDYDMDGRLDIFQTNGHVENDINKVQSAQQYAQKSQLFWNCGLDCERTFLVADTAGEINQQDIVGRSAAYADVDNDGDWDVIVNQVAAPPKLYINQLQEKSWIGITLNSNRPTNEAKLEVLTNKGTIHKTFNTTKSYQSQVQAGKLIGLKDRVIEKAFVILNDKRVELTNLKMNSWNQINL